MRVSLLTRLLVRLLRLGLQDDLEMLTDTMRRSTSYAIQDLASIMCSKRAEETRNQKCDHEFSVLDLAERQWREKRKIGDTSS